MKLLLPLIAVSVCLSVALCDTVIGVVGSPNVALYTYDTACGTATKVSDFPDFVMHTNDQCSLDVSNEVIYINGFQISTGQNAVIGLSTQNGSLVSTTPLPEITGVSLDVNPNNFQIVVTGQAPNNGGWTTTSYVPGASNGTLIASLNNTWIDVLGGPSTFDGVSSTQWVAMFQEAADEQAILGVNVKTGAISIVNDTYEMETLDWDTSNDEIVGVGLKGVRLLAKFGVNMTESLVGMIDGGWFMLDGAGSALDVPNRTLYTVMSIKDSHLKFLVGIDVDSGKTTSAVMIENDLTLMCMAFDPASQKEEGV